MRARDYFALSWLLWGAGYAVYYPFYPLFAESVVGERNLGALYAEVTLIAALLPLAGSFLAERLGPRTTIVAGQLLAGVGTALIPFAQTWETLVAATLVAYAFFLALPSFYAAMSELGEGTISRVWTVSLIPTVLLPFVGGEAIQRLGFTWAFLASGLLTGSSGIPFLFFKEVKAKIGEFGPFSPLPMLSVVPIAVSYPFFTPILKDSGLSYSTVGAVVSSSEVLGMLMAVYLPKFRHKGFVASLLAFSLTPLVLLNPWLGVAFGAWEAVIPLSLEFSRFEKSVRGYAVVNSTQQLGWLAGFAVDSVIASPGEAVLVSSAASLALAAYSWATLGRGRGGTGRGGQNV
ncbi:MAG: MFS transporter [Thermoprotei archaeon]